MIWEFWPRVFEIRVPWMQQFLDCFFKWRLSLLGLWAQDAWLWACVSERGLWNKNYGSSGSNIRGCLRYMRGWAGDLTQPAWLHQGKVWPIWWLSIIDWRHQWTKGSQLMSATWTSPRPLTSSPTTFLSLNWRDSNLKGRIFGGEGIGWKIAARGLWSVALC